MDTLNDFKGLDLPKTQKTFIEQFDGTIESIVNHNDLHLILNPCFSYHYFYVSGTNDANMVTTRDTDGSSSPNGNQSKQAEINASKLSSALRKYLRSQELFIRSADGSYVRAYDSGIKKSLFINIKGELIRIKGLTTNNLYKN
jgi:hypothetical protein